jgi:YidC/Oxa1 family membrane protein insertase
VDWAGLGEQYFMTVVIPEKSPASTVLLKQHSETKLLEVQYVQQTPSLQPSAQKSFEFSLYLGPKRMSDLKVAGGNLDHAINFGFFDVIAKPCLWLMNTIHDRWIPNYGVAIILLTIMFKIIFWPLGSKSYKSMAEMKKLQPLMTQIREKYKNDKKKMNEEVMALYKTYKVNPMSGCLPMIVQIPVFFAFYRMLYGSIELRHAPFIGWITDLSAPDRLFRFDFAIPLMTPPYGIPVLTIIMGATMFIQQKLSPPAGDPAQARMMMMMPLIFTFIFINFPAGLVLYWLVNNVLSISQQYYITKKTV